MYKRLCSSLWNSLLNVLLVVRVRYYTIIMIFIIFLSVFVRKVEFNGENAVLILLFASQSFLPLENYRQIKEAEFETGMLRKRDKKTE